MFFRYNVLLTFVGLLLKPNGIHSQGKDHLSDSLVCEGQSSFAKSAISSVDKSVLSGRPIQSHLLVQISIINSAHGYFFSFTVQLGDQRASPKSDDVDAVDAVEDDVLDSNDIDKSIPLSSLAWEAYELCSDWSKSLKGE